MDWKIPETAPKDGQMIIADFGWPFSVVACWNGHCGKWTVASHQVGPVDGNWNDFYFENDWENPESLKGWIPMPEVLRP